MPSADSQFRITRPFVYRSESSRAPTANPTGIPTARARGAPESRLALTDPAVHVVTDFAWEQPITVPEEISIDAALREMIRAEVRALLPESGARFLAVQSAARADRERRSHSAAPFGVDGHRFPLAGPHPRPPIGYGTCAAASSPCRSPGAISGDHGGRQGAPPVTLEHRGRFTARGAERPVD